MAPPSDCIFCKLASGEIPGEVILEGEGFLAFRDITPQAPSHVLVVPRKHVASLDELEDPALAGELLLAASRVACRRASLKAAGTVMIVLS